MTLNRSLQPFVASCIAMLLGAAWMGLCPDIANAERPNIIYILSDDMGYSDIGCFGSEIETPNLDQLAADGIAMTQFYNTARCCPTRASLLTGLYPHQAGIGHMMSDRGHDGYRGDLNRNCVTIAEVLGSAGYRTYMAGKWHVTPHYAGKKPINRANMPLQRGFDRFYGTIHGAGSFFDPNSLCRDNQLISPFADPDYPLANQTDETFYYTDAITDHAARFIRDHARDEESSRPFFMYVAYTAAHWPMHARPKDIAKYKGRYDEGYEAIRQARYQRMLEKGVIDVDSTTAWSIPEDWKESGQWEWDRLNMEVYAAMIDSMDQGIGRIVATLKATGQFENTLICYVQDNGGCAEQFGRRGEATERASEPPLPPMELDALQHDMQPKQTRDGYPVRTGKGVMAGPADTYIAYGKAWATVSNTPFREYKHLVHEGGISTPCIAHWPKGIQNPGRLEATPAHLVDLMATAVDISNADYPTSFHNGNTIRPMEGKSLQPLFAGSKIERDALYWEHEGNRAIRRGDFKLVAKGAKGKWELYNIADDRCEQHDLASARPKLRDELAEQWQRYAERAHVLPLNPKPPQAGKK
ncbi:MAG: arylsulfatase [Planctomycetota bacterium]